MNEPLTSNQNVGHGHVFPRPDGVRARCGGPSMCSACAKDLARKNPVLSWLLERAKWLDGEMRNGGNLEHLRTRYEECMYIHNRIGGLLPDEPSPRYSMDQIAHALRRSLYAKTGNLAIEGIIEDLSAALPNGGDHPMRGAEPPAAPRDDYFDKYSPDHVAAASEFLCKLMCDYADRGDERRASLLGTGVDFLSHWVMSQRPAVTKVATRLPDDQPCPIQGSHLCDRSAHETSPAPQRECAAKSAFDHVCRRLFGHTGNHDWEI